MIFQSTTPKPNLPALPKIPAKGKGTLTTEPVTFTEPDTVDTRLGSIPQNFERSTGRRRSTREIYFPDDNKEASNRYGRSREIWRAQPVLDANGNPKMNEVSRPIKVEYANPTGRALGRGLIGAGLVGFFGLWAGTVVAALTGHGEAMVIGGLAGAAIGGVGAGAHAYNKASTESVKLEWQKTDINEHELTGYTHRVREDEDCSGFGEDRDCDTDYEHIHHPIIATTKHGEYYKPVVVRYQDSES